MTHSSKLKFVVSKRNFEKYIDEVLCRALPNEPYAKLKYPIEYTEWNRDFHIVLDLIWDEFNNQKWFQEHRDEVRRLIAEATLATRYIAKVVEAQKTKKERNTVVPPTAEAEGIPTELL